MLAELLTAFVLKIQYCTWLNVLCKNLQHFHKVFKYSVLCVSTVYYSYYLIVFVSVSIKFLLLYLNCPPTCLSPTWDYELLRVENILFRFRWPVLNIHRFSINICWLLFCTTITKSIFSFFFSCFDILSSIKLLVMLLVLEFPCD